jgi:hypothetical protein
VGYTCNLWLIKDLGRPLFGYSPKAEHFGQKKYGISYQGINIFVSRSVATRVGCKEEKEVTA